MALSASLIRPAVLIFLLAIAIRLALMFALHTFRELERTEVVNTAVSLASGHGYVNAYSPDSGPTAHMAPLYPILLSVIFRFAGTGSTAAFLQQLFGCLTIALAYALLPVLAVAAGFPRSAGVVAGVMGALLPLSFWAERGTFENPLTAVLVIVLLLSAIRLWRTQRLTTQSAIFHGILSGVALLIAPGLVLLIGGLLAALVMRKRAAGLRYAMVVGVLMLVTLLPWIIRNQLVLGAPIWSRSIFGQVLEYANCDGAVANVETNIEIGTHFRMNPYANPVLLARVKEIGEVRFNAERFAEAKEWIRSHPGKFAQLTLERIWLYWMPEGMRPAQTWLLRMLSLVGFAGMFLAFRHPPPAIRICGIALLTYPVPYYIVGASPRYELPLWPVILLFAGLFVVTMADRARAQVTARRPPLVTSSSL
jgi:Dolichyl-phosphate-mannose-protein mannosyltransferase